MLMPDQGEKPLQTRTGRFPPLAGALSILLSVYIWMNLGPILAYQFTMVTLEDDVIKAYLVANIPFFALVFGLFLSLRFLMRTSVKHVITDKKKIDWLLMLQSGSAYMAVALLFTLGHALLQPEQFQLFSGNTKDFLRMVPLVLIITPIQTTSEEFLMRAIPSRLFRKGKLVTTTKGILWVSLFTALLFTLPHLSNREMQHATQKSAVILYYALFGFGGTFISLKTKGFEPSIGIHAANNLYIALICNYTNSSLPSRPLILSTGAVGTYWDVLQLALGLGAVWWMLIRVRAFKK
ncbi:MAG: CPBP family intramembrane metalloprotease [Sphaerochaeta sp.]|nr:CPBP family intramembrane metalloprotease [Sphaerochaeta sp.]